MMNREIEPRPPSYNDHFETVEISKEDEIIGAKTYDLFYEKLKRTPAWNIKNGVVTITNTREIIGGLENERISEELARLITGFKMVEDFLPDYMRIGNNLTRNNVGLFMLNTQWGGEELQHGLALGSILEQTGYKTRDEIIKEQQESLTRIWKPPFSTTRQIVAHAAFQERGTHLAYEALHRKATAEDASNVARILRLISADEVYHGVGYQLVTQVYHEIDREGTIEDVLHVARNFRMPAENLHRDRLQWLRDLSKVGLLRRNLVAEEVVRHTLKGFGFIPEDVAGKTADEFLKNRNPNYQTTRDARQV